VILLDTHAVLWLRAGDVRLGNASREEIQRAWEEDELAVSSISFWEMAMLREKGRINYPEDVGLWWREQLMQGLVEIPVDGEIGIRACGLEDFHADPADSIIVATALGGHRLVTSDERVLAWGGTWTGWTPGNKGRPGEQDRPHQPELRHLLPQRCVYR
jgi:PIN domain nuclease of toxin-antitoxin system